MASPLSTHFRINAPADESLLARAREELSNLGVTKLEEMGGIVLSVTYDPSSIDYHTLGDKLRSMGIPVV